MKTKLSMYLRRRRFAGFSIIEATVGMGIVGTLIAALMSGFTSGLFSMQLARENLRATQIMLERMETIRLYSWDQLKRSNFVSPTFTAKYDPNSVNQGVTYYGTITLTDSGVSSSYADRMKLVTVQVKWKTGNLDRQRDFTSFISRDGMQNYIY